MTAAVVIPNHLPHLDFLAEWQELEGVHLIVVQDSALNEQEFTALARSHPRSEIEIHAWQDVEDELLDRAWIFPKRTSARRCFGFWKAWQQGFDPILTLDTDCYPERGNAEWLRPHLRNLQRKVMLGWVPSTEKQILTRGVPYRIRGASEVWLSHGVWSAVPDFDASTQLMNPDARFGSAFRSDVIPRHNFFPMCGMNLAFRRELAPAMYFGLHGPDWGIDRFDDIFAGVLAKRVLDHLGKAAVTGAPSVEHRRQSDVFANLRKEAPGMELNENLWQAVRDVPLSPVGAWDSHTVAFFYRQLIEGLPDVIVGEPPGWTRSFKEAALLWLGLFDE